MNDDEARELLQAERTRVEALLGDTRAAGGDDRDAANDEGDMTDPAPPLIAEQVDDAIAVSLTERLEAIARAEERLAAGTYGRSVRSDVAIPDERLRADPTAELTVEESQSES
jgi:DnaK suppressor protein